MLKEKSLQFSYPKSFRIRTKREFNLSRASAHKLLGSCLVLEVSFFEGPQKMGLSVSRRFGKANKRNKFKRRIRELFRLNQHQIQAGAWLHVKPRTWAQQASYQQLEIDFLNLLEKVRCLPLETK